MFFRQSTLGGQPFWMNKKAWAVIGFLIVLLALNPFTCVDSGYKGLLFTAGALEENELDEGINFAWPGFQKIREVTIRPIEITFTIEEGPSAAITKDNQSIGATITLFMKYKQGSLVSLWRDIGLDNMTNIATKTALESYKQVVGQYTIFDIAFNQEIIRSGMDKMIKADLAVYPVEVTEVKVTNYDWSQEFENQIKETMNKAQQVKQKQQELLITEQEAQKQVKQAEAQKTAMITTSEGEKEQARNRAEAKVLEGEGIRKYNASIAANWEIELKKMQLEIERIKAEKWDGAYVPINNYGPIPVQTGGLQGK